MTGQLVHKWLADFNTDVDNCTTHPRDTRDELSHITLVPPPKCNICCPTLFMGIIRNLKALYRKNVVTRLISSGSSVAVASQRNEFAMHMLKTAGQNVKQVSIVNCFAKAGLCLRPHRWRRT